MLNYNNKFGVPLVILTFLFPLVSYAQFTDFKSFVALFTGSFINLLISIVFGLIFLYFFWGVAKYILSAGDVQKKKEGYGMIIYGVIAIFVASSLWGIIALLMSAFGF